jgi:hypothetical protein
MDQTCCNALLYVTFAKEHIEYGDVVKVIERKLGKIETAILIKILKTLSHFCLY